MNIKEDITKIYNNIYNEVSDNKPFLIENSFRQKESQYGSKYFDDFVVDYYRQKKLQLLENMSELEADTKILEYKGKFGSPKYVLNENKMADPPKKQITQTNTYNNVNYTKLGLNAVGGIIDISSVIALLRNIQNIKEQNDSIDKYVVWFLIGSACIFVGSVIKKQKTKKENAVSNENEIKEFCKKEVKKFCDKQAELNANTLIEWKTNADRFFDGVI